MSFEIKKATRQGVTPLIGIYSLSGCGKTMSALLLARGFVGPEGKIVIVDTESGRGSLYADVIPGGYETIKFTHPFSPARSIEVVHAVEQSGATIGILDSGSHEWESIGGVLDMAAEEEARMGFKSLGTWKRPKMEHQKFLNTLLQSSIPWIICLRAKFKTRQVIGTEEMAEAGIINRKDVGKKVVVKDQDITPMQAEDFIYEMTAHMYVNQDHTIVVTKQSHPALRDCFPKDNERPITIEDGAKLAQWCKGAAVSSASTAAITQKPADLLKPYRAELWRMLKHLNPANETTFQTIENWLFEKRIIAADQAITRMTEEELKNTIAEAKKALNP